MLLTDIDDNKAQRRYFGTVYSLQVGGKMCVWSPTSDTPVECADYLLLALYFAERECSILENFCMTCKI